MIEIKHTVKEMNNIINGHINRLDRAKEKISKLRDVSVKEAL